MRRSRADIVIANARDLGPTKDWPGWYVYVGRGNMRRRLAASPLANPYVIGQRVDPALVPSSQELRCRTRDEAVEWYDDWLQTEIAHGRRGPEIEAELERMEAIYHRHGKLVLVCWCAPKRCHAGIIRGILEDRFR